MREAVTLSQHLSITPGCLATVNAFEDLKFIKAISPQSTGITMLEMFTAWK
jgi:hypothetical protein